MTIPPSFYACFLPTTGGLLQKTASSPQPAENDIPISKEDSPDKDAEAIDEQVIDEFVAIMSASLTELPPAEEYIPLLPREVRTEEESLFHELLPTIDRIFRKIYLVHPNDGEIFHNREGRLPRQNRAYYREYVHAQGDIEKPGRERIVVGERGELFYTKDHYRTFA